MQIILRLPSFKCTVRMGLNSCDVLANPEVRTKMIMLNSVRIRLHLVFKILKVAGLVLAIGCATAATDVPNKGIKDMEKSLVGKWKKLSAAECDTFYPDELEFHELATYLGKKGPDQRFIVWDAGTYQVADENHLIISTATDELVSYRFSISKDTLIFVDDKGCEFRYQRLK